MGSTGGFLIKIEQITVGLSTNENDPVESGESEAGKRGARLLV